jgi:thiol-disulfide isomerase/thioredoxin
VRRGCGIRDGPRELESLMIGVMRSKAWPWPLWLAAVFSLLLISCGSDVSKKEREVPSGNRAPDFTLPALDGARVQFSDFSGKVVLVDFWATWCPPCRAELPHLHELYESYKSQGFEILGIALDNGGASVVEPFVRENGIPYRIVIGNPQVAMAFGGLTGIPTAFLIDRSGNIVQKYVGYTDKAVLEGDIKRLL